VLNFFYKYNIENKNKNKKLVVRGSVLITPLVLLRKLLGSGKWEHLRSGEENILEWGPPCTLGGERVHSFEDFENILICTTPFTNH